MYERRQVDIIANRLEEDSVPFIQVVVGARQTGKSTMIAQALAKADVPAHSVSADDEISPDEGWLRTEWQQARNLQRRSARSVVLVLDEVQKVPNWPNVVKGLWDADQREGTPIKVVLSGSSTLLIRRGLEDSLKGRFELIRSPHWSLSECRDAFGFSLDDFLFFGGFPGAARLVADETRWLRYMRDSIIGPTITQDALSGGSVRKPALMRALFLLGAQMSGREVSYNKMLGQLQDAGNTTTLAGYLDLLDKAGMLCGLEQYRPGAVQRKKGSPKFMVYDTGLMSATLGRRRELVLEDSELRGHLVESAVGAHLLALGSDGGREVRWWRDGNREVDFVVGDAGDLTAIEVKSGNTTSQGGMRAFLERHPEATRLVVGGSASGSVTVEEFLLGSEW